MIRATSIACLVGVLLAGGCADKKADLPSDAVTMMVQAVKSGDQDAFMRCFVETPKHTALLEKLFGAMEKAHEMDKVTGKSDDGLMGLLEQTFDGPDMESDGMQAVCTLKDGLGKLSLKNTDARAWQIVPDEALIAVISEHVLAGSIATPASQGARTE